MSPPTVAPEAVMAETPSSPRPPDRPATDDYLDFVHAQTPSLLRLARAMSGSQHDAWDLTQETLVRMGARWSRIDEPAAYSRTVMTRLNIDRLRRLRREAPALLVRPDEAAVEPASSDAGAWLAEALTTLPPRQRTALALRYVEDLDVAGIAARMGCSDGTVKAHLSRGTERLRAWAREHGHLATGVPGSAGTPGTTAPTPTSHPDTDRSDR